MERIRHLPANDVALDFGNSEKYEIHFDACADSATVEIRESNGQSTIVLKEIHYRCPSGLDKEDLLQHFEKQFISKLREDPVMKSDRVLYIWSVPPKDRQGPTPQPSASPSRSRNRR